MNLRKLPLATFLLIVFAASRLDALPVWDNFQIEHCQGATATSDDPTNATVYTTQPAWYFDVQSASPGLMGGTPSVNLSTNTAPNPFTATSHTQALFHMDDAPANGTLLDSSLSGHVLTLNKTQPVTPILPDSSPFPSGGNYLSFSVANSSSLISGLDTFFEYGSFSVETWFRDPPAANWGGILSQCKDTYKYPDEKCLQILAKGKQLRFGFGNNHEVPGDMSGDYGSGKGTAGDYLTATTGNSNDGNWHYLACTYDFSGRTLHIYVDGNSVSSGTTPSTIVYTGTGTTHLGTVQAYTSTEHYTGDLDELRILNYTLSPTEVAAHYFGQAHQLEPGLFHSGPYIPHGITTKGRIRYSFGDMTKTGFPFSASPFVIAEDISEDLGVHDIHLAYSGTLPPPPQPTATFVGYSSITLDWSSYLCNTYTCATPPCSQHPYDNTTYRITPGPGSPQSVPTYTASGLTPNTLHSFSITATYTDNGASGGTIISNASPAAIVRTLAAPPIGFSTATPTGPTSVNLAISIYPNPAGTLCEVLAKQNGVYTPVTSYQPITEDGVHNVLSIGAPLITKSAHYVFAINCKNDAGVLGARGPDSAGDPPASLVSQPDTPTGLAGNATADPISCPKTSINWSWNPVKMGSVYPTPSSATTAYQVSVMNANGSVGSVMCSANSMATCLETGLSPGTNYSRVVQAQDPGAYTQWSDTSTTTSASPTGNYTDAPTNSSGTPTTATQIQWHWTQPPNICASFEYDIIDAQTGTPLATVGDRTAPFPASCPTNASGGCPPNTWTQNSLPINTFHSIRVQALDNYAASQLSPSASAYTLADVPTNLTAAYVSTGSLLLQWNSTNPNYTRFEVSLSPINDLGQPVSFSTLTHISDNWTALNLPIHGLNAGSTYYFRVRAANGRAQDNFGGLLTDFAILASTITLPPPPTLTGTGMAADTVQWTWSTVTGASGYRLVNDAGVPILDNPKTAQLSVSSGPFLPNATCGAKIAAYNSNAGLGPYSAPVYTFTWAATPGAPGVVGVTSNTVSLSWSPNGNASYTFYEIVLATDSAYGVVVTTVNVMSTTTVIGGLFPSATYYARVLAINGSQQATTFVTASSTCTNSDPAVTRSSAPASPYAIAPGLVGLWHLDEASGTWAGDASAWGNTGQLTGSASNSTPTFTTDAPLGLGHAVSFSGMRSSLLSIPDASQYDGLGGSMTVSAWVKPATSAQPDGTGLVAKGLWGHESFGLDLVSVSGAPRYRFQVKLNGGGTAAAIAATPVRTGQWDMVTGVFDGDAAANVTLYINGIFAGSSTTGGLMREINAEPIALGNRKDASANYNLGFSGIIDDIRMVNGALNAAGAASLYRSYFPTQLAPPGVNSSVRLLLPPNAFPSAASIYMSDDPVNHPLRVPYSLLSQALLRMPTGQMLMPPSPTYPTLVEIVPTLDGVNYFNGPLGSSATLSLPYADADGDGILDGSNPPVPVTKLQLYTLDASVLAWNALPTTVDTAAKRVSAPVSHFSIFALFGAASFGQSAADVRIYPIPWKWGSSDPRFGAPKLTFDHLPTSGSIRILTLSGEKVIDLPISSTDVPPGTKTWDGRNAAGKAVASGVYFAQIRPALGGDRIVKFAIEK